MQSDFSPVGLQSKHYIVTVAFSHGASLPVTERSPSGVGGRQTGQSCMQPCRTAGRYYRKVVVVVVVVCVCVCVCWGGGGGGGEEGS